MKLIGMFPKEIQDAKKRLVPLIIPIGTVEFHAEHLSSGCDTLVIEGLLDRLSMTKEIIVAPSIWYGVASYAVCGPEKGTVHVDADPYESYVTEILASLIQGGWKNIYLLFHHQSEGDGLMPMSLACMKAAKKVMMRHLEETRGRGWWGDNSMREYYEKLETADNPLHYIKTVQLMDAGTQLKCGGFDHAGKYETSLMLGLYPEYVDLSRTPLNNEWFAAEAGDASPELGAKMAGLALEYLEKAIR
jgi:creatinine amidohydrolase/Fe(II)-dependent formamide hydrolase-like protein